MARALPPGRRACPAAGSEPPRPPLRVRADSMGAAPRSRTLHLAEHLPAALPAGWVACASRRLRQASSAASEAQGLFPACAERVQQRGQNALPLLRAAARRAH